MKEYLKQSSEVLDEVKTTADGLSSAESAARLEKNGKNKLAEGKKESLIKRFFKQLAEPMTIILLVAAVISAGVEIYNGVASGHWEFPADVVIILSVVLINAILGVFQESKAEKAIEALQEMSKAQSKVLRDGKMIFVPSEDLVVGDVIILEAGDAVPADARILECASLKIEEAALTGESVPVDKKDGVLTAGDNGDVALGDRKNMVFMGSTVVYGRGKAVVTATGMDTEMGKIADALAQAEEGKTPLQIKLAGLSKILTYLVIGICVVIFAVQLLRDGVAVPGMLLATDENGEVVFTNVLEYSGYSVEIVDIASGYEVANKNASFTEDKLGVYITLIPNGTLESPYDIIIGESASYSEFNGGIAWFEINIRGVSEYLLEIIASGAYIEIYDAKDSKALVTVYAVDGKITYVFNDSTSNSRLSLLCTRH